MAKSGKNGDSEQVAILRGIWNEMKALNKRVDQTNDRLEAVRFELKTELQAGRVELKTELEAVRSDLKSEVDGLRKRAVESEVRLATATTELSGDVRELSGLIREWRTEHREDRADIRTRLDRLEAKVGLTPTR